MERFLLLVYAGLTGSVTMISCTVLALTRLFFEFKGEGRTCGARGAGRSGAGHGLSPAVVADHMGLSVVEQLLQNVCLLLGSRTRDVVKAALGFLKVVLLLVDTKLLAKHVQTMVSAQREGWQGRAALGAVPCSCLGAEGAQPWSWWQGGQRGGSSPKYWHGFAHKPSRETSPQPCLRHAGMQGGAGGCEAGGL